MSGRDERDDDPATDAGPDRPDAGGRDRQADRLGELLPEVTRDESASGWGDDDGDADERLRREVPPHHG